MRMFLRKQKTHERKDHLQTDLFLFLLVCVCVDSTKGMINTHTKKFEREKKKKKEKEKREYNNNKPCKKRSRYNRRLLARGARNHSTIQHFFFFSSSYFLQ
jgi:hypothetical protein